MTSTIQSTICGYSIEMLIAFLLGDVNRQTKAGILENAKENRELTAFIQYLRRLLEAHDYDVERVTALAEQQMAILVTELKKFNQELEEDIAEEAQEPQFFMDSKAIGEGVPEEAPHFSFVILAHHSRSMLPTAPLSIRGLQDAESTLHVLVKDTNCELVQHPLNEKEVAHFLTMCRNQLHIINEKSPPDTQPIAQKRQPWWVSSLEKLNFKQFFFKRHISPHSDKQPKDYSIAQSLAPNHEVVESVKTSTSSRF
jgi:hypothetical protein